MLNKKTRKTCKQGHVFYKSSDCPTCPACTRKENQALQSSFPEKLGSPALRALASARILRLTDLTRYTEKEIANLHGMGPTGIAKLKKALKARRLDFKK